MGAKKCVLLACNKWLAGDADARLCGRHSRYLAQYVREAGIEVEERCGTVESDFALMLHAPAVVSAGSSYSFMGGYFGEGRFVSAGHVHETRRKRVWAPWLKSEKTVFHSEIADYSNFEAVVGTLTSPGR